MTGDRYPARGRQAASVRELRARSALPYLELAVALLAGGLWYLQGGSVWYAGAWPGPWPIVLLAGMWITRTLTLRLPLRPSTFDAGLWIFVATAALGVWAAYDRGPAWAKFWLIVGAVGVYYAVAHQPDSRHLAVLLALTAGFSAALTLYFVATNDWLTMDAKVPALASLGGRLSSWLPKLPGHRMHPNVVAGILAITMPLSVALAAQRHDDPASGLGRPMGPLVRIYAVAAILLAGVGLALSVSRGAWLATAAAAGLWATWRIAGRWAGRRYADSSRAWRARLAVVGGALVVALAGAAAAVSLVISGHLPGTALLGGRLTLLRDSLLLSGDYLFTGAGLGMFPMQYSIYTLLIHAYVLPHSHNLLLNMLIEQGIAGPAAYTLMIGACLVRALRRLPSAGRGQSIMMEAGLVGVAVALAQGQFDDSLYSSRGALFLLLPFGVVMAAASIDGGRHDPARRRKGAGQLRGILGIALTLMAAASIIAWLRPVRAAWYANAGALAQAKSELSVYDPAQATPLSIDQVRQTEDLTRAQALLTNALAMQPGNRTACQRLASIAIARADYALALTQTSAAWDAGYRDRVTRLLRGDALVAAGGIEQAAETIWGLEWAEPRLLAQAWYRYWSADDYARAAAAWDTVLLLDPQNEEAAQCATQAREKLAQ